MRLPILPVLFLILGEPVFSREKPENHVAAFAQADALRKGGGDLDETVAAFMECLEMAVEAGDANYANAAGLNACDLFYSKGRIAATGELAERIIAALAPLPPQPAQIMRRVQFFGYIERGHLVEGRLGEAMRANRAAAETLRGKFVDADADGRALALDEAIELHAGLRGYGWRLLEREAEHLDMVGRTNEALERLDALVRHFGDDWTAKMNPSEQFYFLKLLVAREQLRDFLGEKESALAGQKELLEATSGNPRLAGIRATLRMNYLRNLAQWEGSSEEIIAQARVVAEELKKLGSPVDPDLLLAKMEFDLEKSRESADAMAFSAARNRFLRNDMAADIADRDNLLALLQLGEAGLDERFFEMLAKARRKGNKRSEPTLYRMYGDYLMAGKRHGEAIEMYAEALRLTRSFAWDLHEPALLGSLFDARFASGDIAGARAVLAELDDFIRLHPDAPAGRLTMAHSCRGQALAALGEKGKAMEAFATARRVGKDLPSYQNGYLSEAMVERFLSEIVESKPKGEAADERMPPLSVQPLEVTSVALAGDDARTGFSVFNHGDGAVPGSFEISGPSAELAEDETGVTFRAGGDVVALSVPRRIPAGAAAELELIAAGEGGAVEGEGGAVDVEIAWKTAAGVVGQVSSWSVMWDESARGRVVMDASALEASPFRSIVLRHELSVPDGEDRGIVFRVRSPVALRLEYRDSKSGAILAIDDNGDGDFTGRGDFHLLGVGGMGAPVFPMDGPARSITAQVFVFAPDGKPLPVVGAPLVLEAEVFRNGAWVKEAENVIR